MQRERLGVMSAKPRLLGLFAQNCGSQLFSRIASAPGIVAIKTGILDEQPDMEPQFVCWTKSKPDWFEMVSPEVRFEENPG